MFYSGIDLHKRSSYVTTLDGTGKVVAQQSLPNRATVVRHYFAQFTGPHSAVVESIGGWYWLSDSIGESVDLRLAHARGLKAISAAKVKTDKIDSETLALLLKADLIPDAHMISPELRPLRDAMRTRLRLVEKRKSALNSIHRIYEKFNVETTEELDYLYQVQVHCHEEQIELLDAQVKGLEEQLDPLLVPDSDIQRLLWVPGVGKICAYTIYLEIDGIERFPSEKQFFSYCRLVPGARDSGGLKRHQSGSKAGNKYLKLAFSHAAVRAMQYYPR